MGTGRKRVRFADEVEIITERRRSSRIVALEEKKQQEKERKLALALAKKQKDKGKAPIDVGDHLDDSNEDESRSAIYQLLSSFKAMQEGRHAHDEGTSRTNVSSLSSVPNKLVLESVLDFLQRKDTDDLLGEPVNLETVENYHLVVNEPMDFGTMRAKVHEGKYTTLEQFKRDVYLICFNAVNAYPATSRHHKVAKDIGCHATKVFESLTAEDHEHDDLELSLNNKSYPSKKPRGRQLVTSRLVRRAPKPTGRNGTTHSKVPKTGKRAMYWPPSNKSLVSEFLNCNKSNLQLNINRSNYKDSLQRFVKDLGPIAQKVAAQKLEALKFQPFQNGNTPTPNLLDNVLVPQNIIHQLTPHTLTQPNILGSYQMPSLPLPFFNKPLTIPCTISQQTMFINDQWHDFAAALLCTSVYNNDDIDTLNGTMVSQLNDDIDTLNGTMVSKVENVFNYIRQQKTCASKHNMSSSGSSSSVLTHVLPTCVAPTPRAKPLESILSSERSLSRPNNIMPSTSLSRQCVMSQQKRTNPMSLIGDSSTSLSQPWPKNSLPSILGDNATNSSLMYQQRQADVMPIFNFLELSPMCDSWPSNSMSSPFTKQVISEMNLLGPIASQEPNSSSTHQVALGSAMNYSGGGDSLVTQQEMTNSQFMDYDDQQLSLALQL